MMISAIIVAMLFLAAIASGVIWVFCDLQRNRSNDVDTIKKYSGRATQAADVCLSFLLSAVIISIALAVVVGIALTVF